MEADDDDDDDDDDETWYVCIYIYTFNQQQPSY